MSEELDVLLDVAARLTRAGIPYMLTGSTATNFYATPRMTRDIDIVVEIAGNESDRLTQLFENDFYVDRGTVHEAVSRRTMFNLIHQASVIKVDFVVRKDTDYRRMEFSRRRSIDVEGQALSIVAPEDLIISKLEWAKESRSELQLGDVRNLLAAIKGLDRTYMEGWIERLGLSELYRGLKP